MKKILSMLLVLSMIFALVSCGGEDERVEETTTEKVEVSKNDSDKKEDSKKNESNKKEMICPQCYNEKNHIFCMAGDVMFSYFFCAKQTCIHCGNSFGRGG